MEYRNLGKTDIKVSSICLGTMTFGEQNTENEAYEQLDMSLDYGVNFIDTAEMYPVPPKKETYTKTESIIGNWIEKRKNRDQFILATKVIGPMRGNSYIRDGNPILDRKNILEALDQSLKRLKTDYVDLYQIHWPNRNSNFFGKKGYVHQPYPDDVSIEETLEVLDEISKTGKVRNFGISNETAWGAMKYLSLSETKGFPRIVSIQNPYSLLNRTFEIGLAEVTHQEDLGLLAYSPMGFGALSGKYLGGKEPEGARLTKWGDRFSRYTNPQALEATEEYVKLAQANNVTPAQMALAFVTSRSFVTSNIIGATNTIQLKENLESSKIQLSEEVLTGIEAIHVKYSNPSP
jgi:aryl-alcohol dehydrogenase-like predicted oxidoreductase